EFAFFVLGILISLWETGRSMGKNRFKYLQALAKGEDTRGRNGCSVAKCPKCNRTCPDRVLVDVVVQTRRRVTRLRLCPSCTMETGKELSQVDLDALDDQTADRLHERVQQSKPKKWWQFWK